MPKLTRMVTDHCHDIKVKGQRQIYLKSVRPLVTQAPGVFGQMCLPFCAMNANKTFESKINVIYL